MTLLSLRVSRARRFRHSMFKSNPHLLTLFRDYPIAEENLPALLCLSDLESSQTILLCSVSDLFTGKASYSLNQEIPAMKRIKVAAVCLVLGLAAAVSAGNGGQVTAQSDNNSKAESCCAGGSCSTAKVAKNRKHMIGRGHEKHGRASLHSL